MDGNMLRTFRSSRQNILGPRENNIPLCHLKVDTRGRILSSGSCIQTLCVIICDSRNKHASVDVQVQCLSSLNYSILICDLEMSNILL